MEYGVNLVCASARLRHVHSRARANTCRIDNFNLVPVAQSPIARTTRGSSSSSCPAKLMCQPPPPSTTTASGSTKRCRMMVCMWCRRSARAFPLMAVYGLRCGMLPGSWATAFSMVSVTNGKGVTAGTPAATPCSNPFLRWNPLLEPVLEALPSLEPPSSGPFQQTLQALESLPATLPAPPSSTAPFPLVLPFPLIEPKVEAQAQCSVRVNTLQCRTVYSCVAPHGTTPFSPKSNRLQ